MSRRRYAAMAGAWAVPVPWLLSLPSPLALIGAGACIGLGVTTALWSVQPADDMW